MTNVTRPDLDHCLIGPYVFRASTYGSTSGLGVLFCQLVRCNTRASLRRTRSSLTKFLHLFHEVSRSHTPEVPERGSMVKPHHRPLAAYRLLSYICIGLLFTAFLLSLLVGISLPIIKPIYLLKFYSTRAGYIQSLRCMKELPNRGNLQAATDLHRYGAQVWSVGRLC